MLDKLENTNDTHFYTRTKEAFGHTKLVTLNTRVFLGKAIPVTDHEVHRVVRRRGSHIF
jgi:hypothetical protein